MNQCLQGKIAIVTGASRGIGAAIARRFAAEGARVVITARTLQDSEQQDLPGSLNSVAEAIRSAGGECLAVAADLAQEADRENIIAETLRAWGGLDILVNNAARGFYNPAISMSRKRLLLSYEINLFAPLDLMQRAAPLMQARGGGWMLNISSATTRVPEPAPYDLNERYTHFHRSQGPTIYASTKSALERMSAGVAIELAEHGIAVNTLAPVEAVATEGAVASGVIDGQAGYESLETMAEAALLLCSEPPRDCSGLNVLSKPLLARYGRAVHGLDGRPLAPAGGKTR